MNKNNFELDQIVGIFEILEKTKRKSGGHQYYKVRCIYCNFITELQDKQITLTKKCTHLNKNGAYKKYNSFIWENERLRQIFSSMKKRCYNSKEEDFRWYGGKGIKICDEWINNPETFQKWALLNGYKDDLTIDRIDENKNYSPENCRWIPLINNSKYKSTTHLIDVDGETHTGREWSELLELGINTINKYLREYDEEIVKDFIRARKKEKITKYLL